MSNLERLEFIEDIRPLLNDYSDSDIIKFASAIVVFIETANVDGDFDPRELSYIKTKSASVFNLSIKKVSSLVKLALVHFFRDNLKHQHANFLMYLKKHCSKSEKIALIRVMFMISRSDMTISEDEREFIHKVVFDLGLTDFDFAKELVDAALILQKEKEDSQDLIDRDEIEKLKVVDLKEFSRDLYKY